MRWTPWIFRGQRKVKLTIFLCLFMTLGAVANAEDEELTEEDVEVIENLDFLDILEILEKDTEWESRDQEQSD